MKSFCLERKIPYLIIDGVGHKLKSFEDDIKTEEVISEITKFCFYN